MPLFLIVIFLAGGVSLGAQNALPGDALYPVKISVNENVRALFAVSADAQADLDVDLALRRLDEAEKLAAASTLTAETRATVEANFKRHADAVEARVEALKQEDADKAAELSARFESSLEAHQRILARLTGSEAASLSLKVETERKRAADDRVEAEAKFSAQASTETAAQGKLKAAQGKVDEVKAYLEAQSGAVKAEVLAEAEARLKLSQDLLVQGKAKLEAKAYNEAFILFQQALRTAQEARLVVSVRAGLNIEIGEDRSEGNVDEDRYKGSSAGTTSAEIKVQAGSGQVEGRGKVEIKLGE